MQATALGVESLHLRACESPSNASRAIDPCEASESRRPSEHLGVVAEEAHSDVAITAQDGHDTPAAGVGTGATAMIVVDMPASWASVLPMADGAALALECKEILPLSAGHSVTTPQVSVCVFRGIEPLPGQGVSSVPDLLALSVMWRAHAS